MASNISDEDYEQLLRKDFYLEASELVIEYEKELLKFDGTNEESGSIDHLFRIVHTIKGSGYAVKLNCLGDFVHKLESILVKLRDSGESINDDLLDFLLKGSDKIKEMLDKLQKENSDEIDLSDILPEIEKFLPESANETPLEPSIDGLNLFDDDDDDSAAESEPRIIVIPNNSGENTHSNSIKLPKVLVVDDDENLRDMIVAILEESEFKAVEACDGGEALDLLNNTDIDAIITDISMPNVGGIDFISLLKEKDKKIPILVVSGDAEFADLKTLLNMEIDGFLEKPFKNEELIMKLRTCIKLKMMRNNIEELSELIFDSYVDISMIVKSANFSDPKLANLQKRLDKISELTGITLAI